MPKVKITDSKGLVQTAGKGIEFESTPTMTTHARTTAFTASAGGLYTITAGGAVTVSLPLASACAGQMFIFRNGDASANIISGNVGEGGSAVPIYGNVMTSSVIIDPEQNNVTNIRNISAYALTLAAAAGAAVTLVSDGNKFCVLANSGTIVPSYTKTNF
jgi:hypothetical protein